MATKSNKFNQMLSKFYEANLLKEVYSTEHTKVCNVFDQFYIAYNLDIMDGYTEQFPGFMIGTKGLKSVVADDSFVLSYYQNLTPEQRNNVLITLDQGYYNYLTNNLEQLKKLPPNPKLDLEYEKQLIAEQQRKQELGQMMTEHHTSNVMPYQNGIQK